VLGLYGRDLDLQLPEVGTVVARTSGVAASFFRELLRQATLEAANDSSETVRDEHVGRALDRLLEQASSMTKILLGAQRPDPERRDEPARLAGAQPMMIRE